MKSHATESVKGLAYLEANWRDKITIFAVYMLELCFCIFKYMSILRYNEDTGPLSKLVVFT